MESEEVPLFHFNILCYDVELNKWRSRKVHEEERTNISPRPALHAASATHNNKAVICGGITTDDVTCETWVYHYGTYSLYNSKIRDRGFT